MHRSLLIQLGDTFASAVDQIAREHDARADAGVLGTVRVASLSAPVEGVGNLSRPIAALRERLQRDISESLEDLLSLKPTSSEELLLDIFILGNLGEPLVANAITVVVDMIIGIVDAQFRTIFPHHRRGAARRLRVIPMLVLPSARECAKDRDAAIAELDTLHATVVDRRETEDGPEFPVDRVFLLDAVTTRGIGRVDDLVDQVRLFLRVLLFTGVRRDATFASVLESECNDLFASIGIAGCEVDFAALRATLATRMSHEAAAALRVSGPSTLPSSPELLDARVLDDGRARAQAMAELDALPARTLDVDGVRSVRPLASLYAELAERLTGWRELASEPMPDTTAVARPAVSGGGAIPAFGAGLALGGAVFAIAHFGLVLSIAASAATGGAFAVVAALVVFLLLRANDEPSSDVEDDAGKPDDATERIAAIESLEAVVLARKGQLDGLAERFDGIATSFDLEDHTPKTSLTATTYCDVLSSPELLELLFQRRVGAERALEMTDAWLASVGTWEALLRQDARPTADDLDEYCDDHFNDLAGAGLFDSADCRERVAPTLRSFLERWDAGVPVALEGESLKQHDADGFRTPLTAALVAPTALSVELSSTIGDLDSRAVVQYTESRLDDVFIVSVLLDVHPDAVAALAHLRKE